MRLPVRLATQRVQFYAMTVAGRLCIREEENESGLIVRRIRSLVAMLCYQVLPLSTETTAQLPSHDRMLPDVCVAASAIYQ